MAAGLAPKDLAVIRHIALNLLRRAPLGRVGLESPRFDAALDDAHLGRILDAVRA